MDDLDGIEDYPDVMLCDPCRLAETGRRLGSAREDLIIEGADPGQLPQPFVAEHPGGTDLFEHTRWGLVACDCRCHPANTEGTSL